jgi:hypothetical protein
MAEDTCPIDPASSGFHFTAADRRSWREGRTMLAARAALKLLPEEERRRLVAEYSNQDGEESSPPVESEAFLTFLACRLPDPSHALSLCRMDLALTRARSGRGPRENREMRTRVRGEFRQRMEREAWECIEHAVRRFGRRNVWARFEPEARGFIGPRVRLRAGRDDSNDLNPGPRSHIDPSVPRSIQREAWGCIERMVQGRIVRGPHAALVWFHADPTAVLNTLHGAALPPVGESAYPMLFAPGLPDLYRPASAAEAVLWDRLPADDAPHAVAERLLAEGVVTYPE